MNTLLPIFSDDLNELHSLQHESNLGKDVLIERHSTWTPVDIYEGVPIAFDSTLQLYFFDPSHPNLHISTLDWIPRFSVVPKSSSTFMDSPETLFLLFVPWKSLPRLHILCLSWSRHWIFMAPTNVHDPTWSFQKKDESFEESCVICGEGTLLNEEHRLPDCGHCICFKV